MKGLYTVLLLVCSNIFMTFAWYGHLKLQEMKVINNWPLIGVILISWGMAFFEYSLQIPGNRIGFQGNGGPFTLVQLKVDPGSDYPYHFCHFHDDLFSGRNIKMESPGSGSMSGNGRIFCIYEISLFSGGLDRFIR